MTGDGHPFVFIHGSGLETDSWHFQIDHFSKRYQCITYDVRGHGQTGVLEEDYTMEAYAEDLHQLLDCLGVQRFYLAGFSLGGYIALSYTLRYLETVESLVLAGTNCGITLEKVNKKSEVLAAMIRSNKGNDAAEKYLKFLEVNAVRPDLTERISEINKPVLIIVGERDVAAPSYISEEMHRRIEGSQMVVLPDCNHVCIEEQPDTFNSIVSEFLYRVESI
ncbi:alpha/beta fold hydrolase [Chloroflexota bacterium]